MDSKKALKELKKGKLLTYIYNGIPQGHFYYSAKLKNIYHVHIDDDCFSLYTTREFLKEYSDVNSWVLVMDV